MSEKLFVIFDRRIEVFKFYVVIKNIIFNLGVRFFVLRRACGRFKNTYVNRLSHVPKI